MTGWILLGVVLAAVLLARIWTRWRRHRRAILRARRAMAGEDQAEALLREYGYQVVDRQLARSWSFRCDDQPFEVSLRCDLLATADDKTYVAEVKTGELAPRLDTAATRRQLLEYQVAYDVDGVLLVDVEAGQVRVVDFF